MKGERLVQWGAIISHIPQVNELLQELNHRIDEQLKNIPDVPRHKKTKSRDEKGRKASNDAVDAAPAGSRDRDSTQSSSDKDKDKDKISSSEPPKGKQHGEPQAAANEHAQELTKSIPEALKDDVSNGPKEKQNLQKPDSDQTTQRENDSNSK
jgi:hypothetical protein